MKVGFIGLGSQGAPMARRIIDAGFTTVLWARRPETLEPFTQTKAEVAGSIAELAAQVDHVGICVVAAAGTLDGDGRRRRCRCRPLRSGGCGGTRDRQRRIRRAGQSQQWSQLRFRGARAHAGSGCVQTRRSPARQGRASAWRVARRYIRCICSLSRPGATVSRPCFEILTIVVFRSDPCHHHSGSRPMRISHLPVSTLPGVGGCACGCRRRAGHSTSQ